MYLPLALEVIVTLLLLYAFFAALKSSKTIDSPSLYTFDKIKIVTIVYIAVPISLLVFTVVLLINNGVTYLSIMNIITAVALCIYLIYLVFVDNKITVEGIAVRLHGSFTWEEVDKIEITDRHMIVYRRSKLPLVRIVRKFRVRLKDSTLKEISDVILNYGINRKIIYIKS